MMKEITFTSLKAHVNIISHGTKTNMNMCCWAFCIIFELYFIDFYCVLLKLGFPDFSVYLFHV